MGDIQYPLRTSDINMLTPTRTVTADNTSSQPLGLRLQVPTALSLGISRTALTVEISVLLVEGRTATTNQLGLCQERMVEAAVPSLRP